MSKANLLVFLNTYSDSNSSNNPSLSNFKWARNINAIPAANPISEGITLAPGESRVLFDGTRTISQDNTTNYKIELKPLSSNTYILSAVSGTLPNFRTPRSTGADATTQVTVTRNGPLATFTSTGGTPFNFAAVQVGDYVRIGDQFNQLSQGEYKILAKTTTSFTIENTAASAEGPITLGSTFADQIQIYSAAGVQVGDILVISQGFSVVTRGSYKVTSVGANFVEFYSTAVLPEEDNIQTTGIAFYSSAKNLVYLETNQKSSVLINGTDVSKIEPFIINDSTQPGVFMLKSTIFSLEVQNTSTDTALLFLATIE